MKLYLNFRGFLLVILSPSQNSDCSSRHQTFGATNFPSQFSKWIALPFESSFYGSFLLRHLPKTKHKSRQRATIIYNHFYCSLCSLLLNYEWSIVSLACDFLTVNRFARCVVWQTIHRNFYLLIFKKSHIEQLKYAAIANKDIVDGSILRLRTSWIYPGDFPSLILNSRWDISRSSKSLSNFCWKAYQ